MPNTKDVSRSNPERDDRTATESGVATAPIAPDEPHASARAEPGVPAIEPLCPDCAQVRQSTQGAQSWCPRHTEHHPRAHFVVHDTAPSEKPAAPWGFEHE
jgi:hypothetical protein